LGKAENLLSVGEEGFDGPAEGEEIRDMAQKDLAIGLSDSISPYLGS
jgi:hypothetical protein